MSRPRYLIDTNVFIGLEDDHQVNENLSAFLSIASKHSVGVSVHEAARDDVQRDKDLARRSISLSKLAKFHILKKVRDLTEDQLRAQFGDIKRPNDFVDATLLHALSLKIADFLVTEDRGLHERARRYAPELSRRVLYVADAVALLRATYEEVEVPIKYVEEVEAHTIPLIDPIFPSLREDYDGFDEWWQTKCVQQLRKCWVVSDDGIAGIVVRKDENSADTDATLPGEKILKLCTFKVRPENRGIKLGELLMKQVLWFCQSNSYDLVYVTTFPKQNALIDLLEYYGFRRTAELRNGELLYEKPLSRERLTCSEGDNLYEVDRLNYPRFCTGDGVPIYGVPILESYHDELFPELREQPDLFEALGIGSGPKRPGNTIRKVYLCRAQAKLDPPGALLLFYKGKSDGPPSQAITTVGVFEDFSLARSNEDLLRLTGGRSVYSEKQLADWEASDAKPVKVINFLLAGYLTTPIGIRELRATEIFGSHPPQSIFKVKHQHLPTLIERLNLKFEA